MRSWVSVKWSPPQVSSMPELPGNLFNLEQLAKVLCHILSTYKYTSTMQWKIISPAILLRDRLVGFISSVFFFEHLELPDLPG
jgi:hypothetical protein